MNQVYLSLGGNIGDSRLLLQKTRELLVVKIGEIIRHSSLYRTAPWGNTNQDEYLNQVLLIESVLEAEALLTEIQKIETDLGRSRSMSEKWAPRTIDIDILFYNEQVINTDRLKVPHPLIAERRFVLVPMAEIAPNLIHPELQLSIVQLLERCTDELPVTST